MQTHPRPDRPHSLRLIRFLAFITLSSCLAGNAFRVRAGFDTRSQASPQAEMSALAGKIDNLVRNSGAEIVAVAFHDLATGKELLINPDVSFHAASTMKVPVMMEIYRQAAAGRLSLDQKIPIKNDFTSIADGSHYSLTPDSDSEQSLYSRVGQT